MSSGADIVNTSSTRETRQPGQSAYDSVKVNEDSHQPPRLRASSRHYTSLQEHADIINQTADYIAEGLDRTPRHDSRRDAFTWGARPDAAEQQHVNRDSLPPLRSRPSTPPPLKDIVRRSGAPENADSVQNELAGMQQSGASLDSHLPITNVPGSFNPNSLNSYNTRRSSIAAFARGIMRQVPDMKIFPSSEQIYRSNHEPERHDSQDAAMTQRKYHKLTQAPLRTPLQVREAYEQETSPPPVVTEEPPRQTALSVASLQPPVKGSLKDRRKVKMELSMPVVFPNLPARGRPSSPQSSWIRAHQSVLQLDTMARSAPIVEEDDIHSSVMGSEIQGHEMTSSDPMTEFEQQTAGIHNHSHVPQAQYRSSQINRRGNSDPLFARPPGVASSPMGLQRALQEQQARTNHELTDLSFTNKATRTKRWRWKMSSEDTPVSPGPQSPASQPLKRRISFNPFKRADRISDPPGGKDEGWPRTGPGSWHDRQAIDHRRLNFTTLDEMPLPHAFVPPGLDRVPTPPTFDPEGEVKGKLADFFFDISASGTRAPRRKSKAASGGHWDSDAVLMSMNSGINQSDEESEEGPEGPRTVPIDTPRVQNIGTGAKYLDMTTPYPPETWFRIHHGEMLDEGTLTAAALKEQEARRKFEWLIPEHLPNSPLCPLSPIYKGPCKGVCFWHMKKKSANKIQEEGDGGGNNLDTQRKERWADESSRVSVAGRPTHGWEVGRYKKPVKEVKKRRLISLSGS
ncbi:hypothetical protein ACN47E_006882 [Coniothyrium glycines]